MQTVEAAEPQTLNTRLNIHLQTPNLTQTLTLKPEPRILMDSVSFASPVNGKRQGWILVAEFLFNQFVSNFLCRVKRRIENNKSFSPYCLTV
jgi:hypothetical protein